MGDWLFYGLAALIVVGFGALALAPFPSHPKPPSKPKQDQTKTDV